MIADSNIAAENQCLICGKTFATPQNAKRHFRMRHSGSMKQSAPCMVCGKIFKNDPTLKQHLRSMHDRFKDDYQQVYNQPPFLSGDL